MNEPTDITSILAAKVTPDTAALLLLLARLNPITPTALVASEESKRATWRYPKPGDRLRVTKLPKGATYPDRIKVGSELTASQCCESTWYDAETMKSSYAVTCDALESGEVIIIPIECVEPVA